MKSEYSYLQHVKLAPGILRKLREQKGWTKQTLAQQVGVTPATVGNWERGKHACRERYIKLLAQAFGCTVDELTDGAQITTKARHISETTSQPLPKANAIDQHRKACELTVKELAQRMHVSTNTIRLWGNGKVMPSAQKVLLLAQTLGCTVSDLKIPGTFDFDFANFPYNLQRLRCERGLSRAELSLELLGTTRTCGLGHLERGQYYPSFAQITRAMQVLSCTLDDLQCNPEPGLPAAQKWVKSRSIAHSKLRQKRRDVGLSQKELAQALGMRTNYISMWETGTAYPNAASMQKLCNFFHCSPDDLFITPSKSEEKS